MRLSFTVCLAITLAGLGSLPAADRPDPRAIVSKHFKELDKDGNGEIQGDELAVQPWLKLLDENGDGAVTLPEAETGLARLARRRRPGEQAESVATATTPAVEESPRQGPRQLSAADGGIGARLPEISITDVDGQKRLLSKYRKKNGLIIALVSPDCPVSKRYFPTLAQIEKDAATQEIGLVLIAPLLQSGEPLKEALMAAGISAPAAVDTDGAIARALCARVSTDVFLFDPAQTLVYRGAIDDQYGLGYQLNAPRARYLANAIEATLKQSVPEVVATEAPGCVLDLSDAPVLNTTVTYHNRISRIVQANCQECHRAGGVAPFALETYEQVNAKAGMIRRMVERNLMPPWFAAPVKAGEHSPWMNDRSLNERDKADLLGWLNAGKPEGNSADAPLPRQWPIEWQIGTPDLVVQIPKPIDVKATGTMPYQYATVELTLTEDKWVRGIEVQPTAREVVHHVLVLLQEKGQRLQQDGLRGGFFAAYVPGNSSAVYPEGFAKALPAGSKLVFQIHYTPNGTATQDQIRLGMLFAKESPKHMVRVTGIGNPRLRIPAGADNHPEYASIPVPRPVRLLGLMPHMHVRGKAFRYEAVLPDGTKHLLLDVPRYDFNWQLAYRYAEPLALPAGSKVNVTAWFDNSSNNPANPDPTKMVRWGEQTSDEMLVGYVEYYFTDEDLRAAR